MSASLSPRSSPRRITASSSSSRTRRRLTPSGEARATSGTSTRTSCAATSRPGAIEITSDYDALKEAEAILIALPDAALGAARARPLVRARRRRGHRAAAPEGPAGRARIDDVSRHDARAPAAAPRAERPPRRRGLPPRLLPRARRSRAARTGRRRTRRRSSAGSPLPAPSGRSSSTAARSRPSTRSRRPRQPS